MIPPCSVEKLVWYAYEWTILSLVGHVKNKRMKTHTHTHVRWRYICTINGKCDGGGGGVAIWIPNPKGMLKRCRRSVLQYQLPAPSSAAPVVAVFFNITYYMRKREYMAREKMKEKPNQVNCMNHTLWMHETCFLMKYILYTI